MDIVLNKNEYYTGLVNFILFMRLYATNTSKKQKTIIDVFASETLKFGDKKAYPFAELPKVEDYSLTSSLLTDASISYSEEFIGNPIKKKISLSRIEPFLRLATMSSDGMTTFVSYILGLMESAKEDYLYTEIMKDLIGWTPTVTTNKEMLQTISFMQPAASDSATEIMAKNELNQQKVELALQNIYDDLSIFTDLFIDVDNGTGDNATNFKTAVNKSDLIYIGNAKYMNEKVVNLMATMLKSSEISDNFKHPTAIKIPARTFKDNGGDKIIGFVVHRHWYQWFYHFNFMGNFFDIDTARIKNVLHFWYSKGILKGLPAVRLSEADTATRNK